MKKKRDLICTGRKSEGKRAGDKRLETKQKLPRKKKFLGETNDTQGEKSG